MFQSASFAIFFTLNLAVAQLYNKNETKELPDMTIRNLRLSIIIDSIRAYVNQQANPSSDKFDLLLDEQVRQANKTADQLSKMYEAQPKGAGDRTPKEVANLVVDTYSKSLLRFLNPAVALEQNVLRATTEKPATSTEDPIVKSLRNYWDKLEAKSIKVKASQELAFQTQDGNQYLEEYLREATSNSPRIREISDNLAPTYMVPQQGVIPDDLAPFKPHSSTEIKDMLKLIIMDEFKMLESTENSGESSFDHLPSTQKINENTTIDELLTNMGEDCLSVMLCNAGANPGSLGEFGPWAIQRFDGNQQLMVSYIYPELTSAYLEGQRQMGDFVQYCAKRFHKCNLRL